MRAFAGILSAGLLLAACGTSTEDRALSGGGIGALAGTAVGAVTGLTLLEGALIGAGVGAATGALTDAGQIDLGAPIWRRQSSGATAAADPLVRDIQAALNARGYAAGPADGVAGPQTRSAIQAYQQDHGLAPDGEAKPALLEHLQRRASR